MFLCSIYVAPLFNNSLPISYPFHILTNAWLYGLTIACGLSHSCVVFNLNKPVVLLFYFKIELMKWTIQKLCSYKQILKISYQSELVTKLKVQSMQHLADDKQEMMENWK